VPPPSPSPLPPHNKRGAGTEGGEWWREFECDPAAYGDEGDFAGPDDEALAYNPGPGMPGLRGLNPSAGGWTPGAPADTSAPSTSWANEWCIPDDGHGPTAPEDHIDEGDWEEPGGDNGGGDRAGVAGAGDPSLAALRERFPTYSAEALGEVVVLARGDLGAAAGLVLHLEGRVRAEVAEARELADRRERAMRQPRPTGAGAFPALAGGASGERGDDERGDSWRTDDPPPPSAPGGNLSSFRLTGQGPAPFRPMAGTSGADFAAVAARPSPAPAPVPVAGAGCGPASHSTASRAEVSPRTGTGPPVFIDWVEAGSSVAADFSKCRADAERHMRERNGLYERAQAAHRAGDSAAAGRLSAQARAAGAAMSAAHRQAAARLFAKRNPAWVAARASGCPPPPRSALDLHGLFVAEALELLSAELTPLLHGADPGFGDAIQIVCGAGQHTRGQHNAQGGLRGAVGDHLRAVGVPFREVIDGTFLVELRRR